MRVILVNNNYLQMMRDEFEDGFSSNSEVEEEGMKAGTSTEAGEQRLEESSLILRGIDPPPERQEKVYSLEPDILTGWAPKIFLPKPIQLSFADGALEYGLVAAIRSAADICYLGPRFSSTYSSWRALGVPFPYGHLNHQRLCLTDRHFLGNYSRSQRDGLLFDSLFQCGNLDVVQRVGQLQYDCYMRVDANTKGHLQWFYFTVKGMVAGERYRINICNFQKNKTLYTRGMGPYIFSRMESELHGGKWRQSREDVLYRKNSDIPRQCIDKQGKFFRLTFNISTAHSQDELSIAYCPPYSYTKLINFIACLQPPTDYLSEQHLCLSLGGLKLPLLTVTSQVSEQQALFKRGMRVKNKKMIFVMGRIHPGQCNASYMIEGFIQWLCSHSRQSQQLRHKFVFKILPMANPDGVVLGNYRAGLSGRDFNRQFISPPSQLFVEVYELKKFLQKCKSIYQNDFNLFMDFHGHTVKKNVFTYGPQFPITDTRYYQSKLIPKLIARRTPLFRYHSCVFKITPSKESTARAVLLKQLRINYSYTIQASNGSFYDHQEFMDIPFNNQRWVTIGVKIGEAIFDYWQMMKVVQAKKEERRKEKEMSKIKKEKVKRIQSSVISNHSTVNGSSVPFSAKYKITSKKTREFAKCEEVLREIYNELAEGEEKRDKCSDDDLSQGRSDSQSEANDLQIRPIGQFLQLEKTQQKKITFRSQSRPSNSKVRYGKRQSLSWLQDQSQRQKKLFDLTRERVQLKKRTQTFVGGPSPIKQPQASSAKVININFLPHAINTNSNPLEQRNKKVKTETIEIRNETRRVSRQEQFDSYRKTHLSLHRQTLKKDELRRKSKMNSTFTSVPPTFSLEEIVGKRIFTQGGY